MGAKFHSTATFGKAAIVLAIAVATTLLVSTGYAEETPAGLPADDDTPPCEYLGLGAPLAVCIDWCNKQGYYGRGYLHEVCCCGPRLPPPQAAVN